MTDLVDTIDSLANKAASVTADGQSITRQKIQDVIAADEYKAKKKAAKRPGGGISFGQITFPGAAR